MDGLGITVAGQLFRHRLFFTLLLFIPAGKLPRRLVYFCMPMWCWAARALPPFPAACRTRSDNWADRLRIAAPTAFSAAFGNLSPDTRKDMRKRYETLIKDYSMEPTRNNRGKAHENGSIESRHGHLKSRIEQALLLRGSRDFESVDEVHEFVAEIVAHHNAQRQEKVDLERARCNFLSDMHLPLQFAAFHAETAQDGHYPAHCL